MRLYYKRNLLLVIFAVVISILSQIVMPVSAVLEQKLIDFIIQCNVTDFVNILGCVAVVTGLSVAVYYIKAMVNSRLKAHITENLRNDLYESIMRRGVALFNSQDTAEYISILENDAETVADNYSTPIWSLIGAGFAAIVSMSIMFYYNVLLMFVAMIGSFLAFWLPIIITKKLRYKLVEKSQQEAEITINLKESFNGHNVVSEFGVFDTFKKKFTIENHKLSQIIYNFSMLVARLENSSVVMGKITKLITFSIAGVMAIKGHIIIGTVLLFVSLYEYFNSYVMLFSQCVPLLRSCKPIKDKLMNILSEADESSDGNELPSFENEIKVCGLSFAYKENQLVLKNLDFIIHKCEKIVMMGQSGCGKSTFIKLISGNYNEYQGNIFFDNMELRTLDKTQLHKIVTVINQNVYMFNDTIRNNICLGENFSEEKLDDAIKRSGVDRFIQNISGGIDGECGEGGCNLSGGQKQRIAIARALIRNVNFLILDEGVSAIDINNANMIEQELLDMPNLTLLTITHRIKDGLNEKYDRMVSMADGRIIGS